MWFAGLEQIMLKVSRIRFVAAVAAITAVVGLAGHLDAVDQAQALGGASTATVREWDSWRADNPQSAASAYSWDDIPACVLEDGSFTADNESGSAYQAVCKWAAKRQGNRRGTSYVLVDGSKVVMWR